MITCDEFLKKAQQIYDNCSSESYSYPCEEIDFRNCARIAYYYLYHHAYVRAKSLKGGLDNNTGSHQRVIDKLLESSNKDDNDLGMLLVRLRPTRVKADYQLDQKFSKGEAYKTLRYAEKFIP
ncbi:hypothetical protein [Citrobacter freundii]|uniref:hypothetical protein n=1 Tax=Citrobacter freundii TaxID=546 RepID=UPI00092EDCFA|nr:hypothetical protein [Citrobacter freundii]MDE9727320.1 hypothetical protein [Citrobacter freundii]MEB1002697.1 hypothetical protein [Citrobacter freundii]